MKVLASRTFEQAVSDHGEFIYSVDPAYRKNPKFRIMASPELRKPLEDARTKKGWLLCEFKYSTSFCTFPLIFSGKLKPGEMQLVIADI